VNVTAVNDAPVVTPTAAHLAWTEADPAIAVDTGLTLTDPDSATFSTGTVQITGSYQSGHDILAFTANGSTGNIAAGAFDGVTGKITLTSAGGTATAAQWEAAFHAVTFGNDSNTPGPARTLSFTVDDGAAANHLSATATRVIDITEINSAPAVTTSGGSAAFVENAAAVVVDSGITVSDSDSTSLTGATAHISTGFVSAQDVLSFTAGGGISGSYNAATGTLTMTGTATLAQYQTALDSVKYNNTSDTPSTTTRTIEFQVDDGQSVNHASNVGTRDVTVTAANDPPVLATLGTLSYTENDAATAISTSGTVVDPDSADFNGGSLTVHFSANGTVDDQLAIGNQGTGAGQIGATAGNLTYGGVAIGTYTGGVNGADLVVSFTSASATAAAAQALVRDITFSNTSEAPSTSARTVAFTLVDGDGGSDTGTANATVNVTAVNDAPVNTVPGAQTINEDTVLTFSSGNSNLISIADIDVGASTEQVTLTGTNGTVSLSGTAGLSFSVGDGTTDGTMTFSGTLAAVNTALSGLTFHPTANFYGDGTLDITTNDLGHTGGGAQSDSDSVTVHVSPINDAPVVTAGGTLAYTENDAAAAIKPGLTVTDVEGDQITGATVSITSNYAGAEDVLSFTASGGITGSYSAGTLTLSGTASTAAYQTVLDSVTYQNTSENPATAARTVTFSVTDDNSSGATNGVQVGSATTTVTVASVNDAPVNTVPTDASLGTAMSNTAFAISGISVADVDAGAGPITVKVDATIGGLTFSLAGGATVSAGVNGTGTVTLSGTPAQVNAALATLSYKANDGITSAQTETITVTTNDGGHTGSPGALSDVDTFHVGVIPQVFIIDNTGGGTGGSGTVASPFKTIADFNASASVGTGDYVLIKQGTGTYSEADGINLQNNDQLYGDGSTFSFTNPVTNAVSTFGSNNSLNTPTISVTGASQHGIDLGQGNTIKGLNVATTLASETGIVDGGGTVGALTISSVNVTGVGMGVDIDQGGTLNVAFGTLSSSGSSQQGVQLAATGNALTGTFTATTGAIAGSTGTAFLVGDGAGGASTGGSVAITYGGTISSTGAVKTVDIEDRSAGNITLSGTISHASGNGTGIFVDQVTGGTLAFSGASDVLNSGTSNAVSLTNNTGATINFNGGGLNIVTTSGSGFVATGGGTVNVTGSGNTVTAAGGAALDVANTTIGSSGLTFQSISANGGTNGIILNTTGTTAGLTITGDSGSANNFSGGTIQNTTGDGVLLTSTKNVSFDQLKIFSTSGNGINGTGVTNFSFTNGTIATTGTGHALDSANIAFNTGGASSTTVNVSGTVTLTGSTLTNSYYHGLDIQQGAGTISNINVSNDTFTSDTLGTNSLGTAIRITLHGTATTVGSITTGTFDNDTITNFPSGAGILIQGGNTTAASGVPNGTYGSNGSPIVIDSNTIHGLAGTGMATQAINYSVDGSSGGVGYVTISNNDTKDTQGVGIAIDSFGDASVSGSILNNTIVSNSVVNGQPGIAVGVDQHFGVTDTPSLVVDVEGNVTSATQGAGILGVANANGIFDLTLKNNNFAAPLGGVRQGIIVRSGNNTSGEDATVYLDISGNTSAGTASTGAMGIGLRKQGTSTTVNVFAIEDMTGNGATPNVESYVNAANPSGGGTLLISATSGFTSVNRHPMNADHDYTLAGDHLITPLARDDLDHIVSAAIDRWAAAGATPNQIAAMHGVSFEITNLLGTQLGQSAGPRILIDSDAAGAGWFVDATPYDDSEFGANGVSVDAVGKMDLLTVVMHELGHQIGLGELDNPVDLMFETLASGERRLPTPDDVAHLAAVVQVELVGQSAQSNASSHGTGEVQMLIA
jgi:large repetitive protein